VSNLISIPKISSKAFQEMFDYRLARLRQSMGEQNVSLSILTNPVSLRYAIDFDEYQVFQSNTPTCYLFVPLEGPLIMHGATRKDFPNVLEYRRPNFISPFDSGLDLVNKSILFSKEVGSFMNENCHNKNIAIERFSPLVVRTLSNLGYQVSDAECLLQKARMIKHQTEIQCIKNSLLVAEYGMKLMHENTVSGITERELWSILHQVNIANNGSWVEGHMLSSGIRTNPWLQEASERIIEKGDMVAIDTDMVGPKGYMADISRSWVCEGGQGTLEQKIAYQHAFDEVSFNIGLIMPGMSFLELSSRSFQRKKVFKANHYPCVFHGVGLTDEYPKIYYEEDWERDGYDGLIEPNMVLCVESYSGKTGGDVGVKLEEMVLVNENGVELLSHYPFEESLIN
jgi:Xaa-Pro dipeptidase|tara:strand:+ start:4468 stop:5661 length:1194 start_codon:yes stop_codon:yes gene_type:complete